MDIPHLAIVDDDEDILDLLEHYLTACDLKVTSFNRSELLVESLESNRYDLVISDVMMPGQDGLSLVSHIKKNKLEIPIVLISAHANVNFAVEAIRNGAYDFILKPFSLDQLKNTVQNVLFTAYLKRENANLKNLNQTEINNNLIISKSRIMTQICDLVERIAPKSTNVLITGESGTGKEVLAREIHQKGKNPQAPFIAINCSAIPEHLLESELFGHTKGSFTGAIADRKGLFEQAKGGTIFLDEIGDMPIDLQTKLLRVLQEKKIRPVGKNTSVDVDVRILAATHRNLKEMIKNGSFRGDLYYRLNVIPIHLPPLRERKVDIIPLAIYFFKKYKTMHDSCAMRFSPGALSYLQSADWEGNVRELENTIERAVVLSTGEEITHFDLQTTDDVREVHMQTVIGGELPSLKQLESKYIKYVLDQVGQDKNKAAKILGKSWRTVYRKLGAEQEQPVGLGLH